MTDKEKIRAEIERQYEILKVEYVKTKGAYVAGRIDALDYVEQFIDSLPEEPTIEAEKDLGEIWLRDREGCFWDGVAEGRAAAEKEFANVVDAEIVKDIHNLLHVKSEALPMPTEHKFGDKVRIIILSNEYNKTETV